MRNELILANINDNARIYCGVNRWSDFYRDTFSPSTVFDFVVLGSISGKTYAERKENARQKAVDVSLFDCGGLSWWECSELESYFEKLAHRFGLVREFKENGII